MRKLTRTWTALLVKIEVYTYTNINEKITGRSRAERVVHVRYACLYVVSK